MFLCLSSSQELRSACWYPATPNHTYFYQAEVQVKVRWRSRCMLTFFWNSQKTNRLRKCVFYISRYWHVIWPGGRDRRAVWRVGQVGVDWPGRGSPTPCATGNIVTLQINTLITPLLIRLERQRQSRVKTGQELWNTIEFRAPHSEQLIVPHFASVSSGHLQLFVPPFAIVGPTLSVC